MKIINSQNFGYITKIITILSFILGTAYLIGYWWAGFDINIFPYVSLLDLLKFAACPFLLLVVPFLLIYNILFIWHFIPLIERLTRKYETRIKSNTNIVSLTISMISIIAIIFGVFQKLTILTIGLPLILVFFLGWVKNLKVKQESDNIVNDKLVLYSIVGSCLLPFLSYDIGYHNALDISDNKQYSYIIVDNDGKSEVRKFLGHINGYYFFMDRENNNLYVNSDITKLDLHKYIKHGQQPNPSIGFT